MIDGSDWSFRRRLIAALQEQIDIAAPYVLGGNCVNFEDYKFRSGRLSAYRDVLARIEAISDEMAGNGTTENNS